MYEAGGVSNTIHMLLYPYHSIKGLLSKSTFDQIIVTNAPVAIIAIKLYITA
jgi:hypothetical protein